MKILFVAVFSPSSTNVSQVEAFERLGHEVSCYDYRQRASALGGNAFRDTDLVQCAREVKPHFILFSKCNEITHNTFVRCCGIAKTALWYMDSMNNFTGELVAKIRSSHWNFFALQAPYERAKQLNQSTILLHEGFDSAVDAPLDVAYRYDISFIGNLDAYRQPYYEAIRFHCHTNVFKTAHAKVVSESKILLNFTRGQDGTSDRTYKTLAASGFLLTEYWQGMEKDFADRKDLVVFDGVKDLKDKITYYLMNGEMRDAIRFRGYNTVQKFSRDNWAATICDRMGT